MVNAVLISADSKLSLQVKDWFRELAHEVRLEAFASLKEFAKVYTEDSEAEILARANDATLAAVSEIKNRPRLRLMIVDADLLESDASKWTSEARKTLSFRGFEDPEQPLRVLLLAFEDPNKPVGEFRHSSINDLVLKPLERSLFLQKIEFLIADTPDVKPSFLFRQPVHTAIEMGKDTHLEEISEFGASIANPSPLKSGMMVSLHSEVFGKGLASQIYARVLGNIKHPIRKEAYLVRLTYFGMTNEQLTHLRHYIRDNFTDTKPVLSEIERTKRQLMTDEADRHGAIEKRVAIVEMNRDIAATIESSLRSHFIGLDVRHFSSYARFMNELLKNSSGSGSVTQGQAISLESFVPASAEEADLLSIAAEAGIGSIFVSEDPHQHNNAAKVDSSSSSQDGAKSAAAHGSSPLGNSSGVAKKPAFPSGKPLTVMLEASTNKLIKFDDGLTPGTMVLARRVMEWSVQPELWNESIHAEDKEEFHELLNYISHGTEGSTLLRMTDANGETVYVEVRGILEKVGTSETSAVPSTPGSEAIETQQLRVTFREIDQSQWQGENEKHRREEDSLAYQFDLIFIDGAFVRGDVASWVAGLKTLFSKTGVLLPSGSLPPIVILGEQKSSLLAKNFRSPEISGFLAKPLDRRAIHEFAFHFVPEIRLRVDAETLTPHPCKVPACTASDALMNGISEFGLSILQNSPTATLRPNSYMRFFSPIFDQTGKGVLGRCAFSQAVTENEKTVTEAHFHFFGVNDELFSRIRAWIVENYVNSKQGS